MSIIKIALVLYTHGIDYDDRIRKEILSIQKLYPNIYIKIFALEPGNKFEEGTTVYGVPYRKLHLKARERFSFVTSKIIKSWDFHQTIKRETKDFDYLWCADFETSLIVLLSKKKVVWDLHELPSPFMGNLIYKKIFNYMVRRCSVIIHANKERIDYLEKIKMIENRSKHYYLKNYASQNEFNYDGNDSKYDEFVDWLNNRKCVYLQGVWGNARAGYESISAIMKTSGLCAVVLGGFNPAVKDKLFDEYGEELHNRVFFAGMIRQHITYKFIQKCIFTLIFYKNTSPNNYYCEPNRLYQCVINGNVVITGNNPPMREIISKLNVGISIDNDGTDIDEIVKAIDNVLANYDYYKKNVHNAKCKLQWESQENIIQDIIKVLLSDR